MDNNVYYNSSLQSRYIGSKQDDNPYIRQFFSKDTVDKISTKCTEMLKGVDKEGRDIIIPDKRILDLMNTVYLGYRAPIGFDQRRTASDFIDILIGQTIAKIVYEVDTTLSIEQAFAEFTPWNAVYGDFNSQHLRGHAPIKIRNKKPTSMQFNMNY